MHKYFQKLYAKGASKFYEEVEEKLQKNQKMFIITANPETFTYGTKEKKFNEMLLDKNVTLIPDGIGIVKAAQILNYQVKERITGIDLATELLRLCNKKNKKLALLGAKAEVLTKLVELIKKDYEKIKIVSTMDGYQDNKDEFFKEIEETKPDVILVALGIPNQEKLIYDHIKKYKKGIFIGVGGSFDVLSGSKKRAPKLFQKLNIEWLYRIAKEPKRLKRFYTNNIKFIIKIKKLKKEFKKFD